MPVDRPRPSPLSGLWSCVVGGLLLAALLIYLDPISRFEDCPNYGGSGNASAYPHPLWDLVVPLLALLWVSAVIVEQFLPETWHHRRWFDGAARALVAVTSSVFVAFFMAGPPAVLCR